MGHKSSATADGEEFSILQRGKFQRAKRGQPVHGECAGLAEGYALWYRNIADGSVVGRYTYRARHTGPFMGIPPFGADITMRSIDIWRIRDGVFAEHWDELNTLEVFQQMGAIDMRGGPA